MKRTGKIYRTRIYLYDTNPTVDGEKLLDNKGLVARPSTDTEVGQDDYLNGQHPMFEWVNVNYKRNDDGSPYPIAIEGDANFKLDGDADVGVMQMSFYYGFTVDTANGYVDIDVYVVETRPGPPPIPQAYRYRAGCVPAGRSRVRSQG